MDNYFEHQIISPRYSWQQIPKTKSLLQLIAFSVCVITAITVIQDLIHSRLHNYSFYLSESILFKTFWFLFFPLLFFQWQNLRKTNTQGVLWKLVVVLIPVLAHLLLMPLVVLVVSAIFYSHTFRYYQTLTYTIAEDIYKLLLIYSLLPFVLQFFFARTQSEGKETDTITVPTKVEVDPKPHSAILESIVISNGRNYTPIEVSSILYIRAATPYVAIQLEGKRYLHTETLKSISEKLDKLTFVRVHKSTIVNLRKVASFKSRLNGDYDLLLKNGDKLRLSRNYAENFKRFFQSRPQLNQ
jgi:two-component system, LytTR family, response regulator